MAATETRLLLLGTVMLFEPVNGYQLRRELLSWQVEDWAHVNPGLDLLRAWPPSPGRATSSRHDLVDGTREVAVYTSTTPGRREFERLWRTRGGDPDLLSPLPFHTAHVPMPLMSRTAVREALQTRLANLDAKAPGAAGRRRRRPKRCRRTSSRWPTSGWGWVRPSASGWSQLIARVDRGELALRGEPADWQAPADDPGWQMASDRQRYVELIARQA